MILEESFASDVSAQLFKIYVYEAQKQNPRCVTEIHRERDLLALCDFIL